MIDRQQLLKDLQRELPKLEKDILAYSEQSEERTAHLKQEYAKAKEAGRTAEHFVSWREAQITQAAVAWVLTCVFVRFLEDNGLLAQPVLSGPVERENGPNSAKTHPLKNAKDRIEAYFNEHPTYAEREYLLHLFEQLEQIPVIAELLDHRHNPLWQIPVSADGAKSLIDFFQKIDPETGQIIHDFTDPDWDTRFLGDLYQDLSEAVRKRYALLQTPEFVESFILDYTLEPAIKTFGLEGLRLIDPTCGSGHFLLTTFERIFERWQKREPATNSRVLAQRALDVVHGVDINPYAIAICRFRLLMAAMKACEIELIKDAPAFQFNLACGDSLLHGRRFEWQGQGIQQGLLDDELKHVFEVEDKDKLEIILGQQFHAVVGNPPYIIVRDKALNKAYRTKYPMTCYKQYSLGAPFTERFFELCINHENKASGYMGIITTNSFMKRDFGKPLVENHLSRKKLTHIIDTSGAYIPGHGTPTVILFGRNSSPDSTKILSVLGINGEPDTPPEPENGAVWSSIVSNINRVGFENEFVSVVERSREEYSTHPWSLSGGGASEIKNEIERKSNEKLNDVGAKVGRTTVVGEDDLWIMTKEQLDRLGAGDISQPLVIGEPIRDWILESHPWVLYPYASFGGAPINEEHPAIKNYLWKFRTLLKARSVFGKSLEDMGRPWYEHLEHYTNKLKTKYSIPVAFVASHNHFYFDRGGKLFKQSAPIIKIDKETDDKYFIRLVAYLNTSLVCFWLKQVCHQKQLTGGDGVRVEYKSKVPYEFAANKISDIPLYPNYMRSEYDDVFLKIGKAIDLLARELENQNDKIMYLEFGKPGKLRTLYEEIYQIKKLIKSKMVLLQEELDWTAYVVFNFCDRELLGDVDAWESVGVTPGQRPFEIVQQLSQEGFEVPSSVPDSWPETMRECWQLRMEAIKSIRQVQVIEDSHYKRRWIGRQGLFNKSSKSDELQSACKWNLKKIVEEEVKRAGAILISCSQLSEVLSGNERFQEIAEIYVGREDVNAQSLIEKLVNEEAIPQIPQCCYKTTAIKKYRAWKQIWEFQRLEDSLDAYKGVKNSRPPKYVSGDFRKPGYWALRGKFDVPKERFFSLPGCEKDGDNTLVIGWAGLDPLQRAQAIAAWYEDRKENDGWEAERLMPMLVAIDELIPWLKQWHNDIDPEYGERMGDFYESYLLEELRRWELTREELLDWRPPTTTRRRR